MTSRYLLEQLTQERVDQAYAVASLRDPALQLRDWRSECTSLIASGSILDPERDQGVLLVLDNKGYIRGLCRYHTLLQPGGLGRLEVPTLIVASLLGASEIAAQIVDGLDQIARLQSCSWMTVSISPWDAPGRSALTELGFTAALTLSRPVAGG